jgi:hypothetical protein
MVGVGVVVVREGEGGGVIVASGGDGVVGGDVVMSWQ